MVKLNRFMIQKISYKLKIVRNVWQTGRLMTKQKERSSSASPQRREMSKSACLQLFKDASQLRVAFPLAGLLGPAPGSSAFSLRGLDWWPGRQY